MQRLARAGFIFLIAAMLFLFFTNDFGLVDIHKTSIVVAVGIDIDEEGYAVTAQAAVPTPAQGEGSTAYTQVTGTGRTVAEALDDINAKIGFYPKLTFCNLIILGESCLIKNVFTVLDYFYRNDYVPLTALVGTCRGTAKEMLGQQPSDGGMSSSAIQRSLSEELRNSANASVVNLKMIAQSNGDKGKACFMPVIDCTQGGSGGTTAASASGSSSDNSEEGGGAKTAEFTCLTTAVFSDGVYVGTLNEEQAFALNLIKSPVRLAVVNTSYEGNNYTVGLKNNSGSASPDVVNGLPVLKLRFRGLANIQAQEQSSVGGHNTHIVPDGVLDSVSATIKSRLSSLIEFCMQNGCDVIGAEGMFYRLRNKDYKTFGGNILNLLKVEYDVKIKSAR